MAETRVYTVEDKRLPIWLHALANSIFETSFSVPPRHGLCTDNRHYASVRDLRITMIDVDGFRFLEHYVSQICYSKGYIQNLTKKENPYVRKADRQVPEKVCPSTGEACQHDDGSGNCMCEGESERLLPEGHAINLDSMLDVR